MRFNVIFLPLAFALSLAALALLTPVGQDADALRGILGVAAVLCAWNALLFVMSRGLRKQLQVEPRKQHYLQACAQGSVLLYWGWYWPPVYAWLPFILAQLLFAYAFDLLLSWSRRSSYTLGFGPFPIVFSINLFLWFKADWFALQLLLVGLGLAAKEFLRWNREGRNAHIFNPSSFPLAVFSLILLATGGTSMTWGPEIATTQFYPPHMYLFLFLIGLPGQLLFGVTTMTMSAVLSAYIFSRVYFGMTGIYFFYDSDIPIAVFLGMHLLFTDPATSPRTVLGRILHGTLYGLGTVLFYQWLGKAGMPTFYDKLLPVPILNLLAQALDRVGRVWPAAWSPRLTGLRRNFAYVAMWVLVFGGLRLSGAFRDDHPGQYIPFWERACDESRPYACPYLADLEQLFCDRGSGWACNEAGLMHVSLYRSGEDSRRAKLSGAAFPFRRGCELRFAAACQNLELIETGTGRFTTSPPEDRDWPILLRGSKGEIREGDPGLLRAMACRQGWEEQCGTP